MLCLLIQGILLQDLLLSATMGLYSKAPAGIFTMIRWALLFLVPGAAWVLLKDYLSLPVQLSAANAQLARFKQEPDVFKALIPKEPVVTYPYKGLGIHLGNAEAKHVLIQVCDPYCVYCAAAYPVVDRILNEQPDVQVRLLFRVTSDSNDKRQQPVRHLLAIAEEGNQHITRQALRDWYRATVKDYAVFAASYPLPKEITGQDMHIDKLHAWTKWQKIDRTPTYFLDGHRLPPNYNIDDFRYLLIAGMLNNSESNHVNIR